ncbi:MAG: hypothetical protein OEV44_08705, partial [Spirochaetota bacterium]|nr:hypothetical protein [Spirochaetota bacterium]
MKNLIAILISINLIFFGNFLFSKSSKSELNVKSEKNYIAQAEDSDDADDDDNDDETESKAVKPDNKKPEAETIKADADKTKTETTTNTTAKLPKAVRTPSMLSKIARIKRGDNIILKEIRFDTFKNLLLIINEDAIRNNKTIDEELAVNPIEKRKIIKTLIGGIYNADPRVRLASVYGMKIILKSLENVKIPEKTKSGVPYTEDEKEKLNKKYKKIYYRTILDIHPETRRAWYLETVKELKSYTPAYDKTKPQKSPISWRDSLQNDKEDGDSKFTYKDGKKYYTPAKNWKNEYLGLTIKGEPILQTVYNELNMLDLYVTRIIVVSRIQAGTLGREDLRRADPRI